MADDTLERMSLLLGKKDCTEFNFFFICFGEMQGSGTGRDCVLFILFFYLILVFVYLCY